ncbi:sulfurtransferase [Wenzhouxiangella sp. AB-CW3]|uniref:sulfurtransferase n=1 Tax=Wenzhouxiangella sp. AB-CW3 TaxID=2771012 RepID=UPI00168C0966|nr:sulfurtransferase [Wenzhouxiangella sp. AB-CW3]QOC21601.1 sulfurtransferase [Wenzhouxiangella sp. AB-CW3]
MRGLIPFIAALLFSPLAALASSEAIVDTEWLTERLDDPGVRVIEVSVNPGVYEQGHIPGAVNFRWHTDLVDTVRRDLVSPERFESLLSEAGIDNDTTVVLYGDHNNWFAAWGAWVFDQYGHADVRLLDGGRKKWELESRPLSTVPPSHRPAEYTIANPRPELRARIDDVLAAVEGEADYALVDIRSPDEYSGRVIAPEGVQELAIRAGHVPGAVNIPWNRAVNQSDGTFLPADELRELYAEAGIDGSQPIIVYCRIGERSSHTWFLLKHILGYEVKNYDGSWTEYGNAVGVPIDNPAGNIWTGT